MTEEQLVRLIEEYAEYTCKTLDDLRKSITTKQPLGSQYYWNRIVILQNNILEATKTLKSLEK